MGDIWGIYPLKVKDKDKVKVKVITKDTNKYKDNINIKELTFFIR
jgi:hypothetical protein